MVLTLQACADHIEHTLGGELSPELSVTSLVNQAGEYLCTIHPWKWLENQEAKLNLRANVTATGLNFTKGTTGLDILVHPTATPFADYTKVTGDLVEVTAGTGVRKGFYVVDQDTEDDLYVVQAPLLYNTGTIAAASLTNTDIACTIHTNRVQLPKDFRELIAINSTSGLLKGVQLTTYEDLLKRKASSFASAGFYWAAVGHARDSAGPNIALNANNAAEPVTPVLEIWPTPPANEAGALTIYYRSGWPFDLISLHEGYGESAATIGLRIPRYLESLFLQLVRAFARGYEEEDDGTMNQRLTEVMSGPLFLSAVERDGSIQPHYGPMTNGAIQDTSGFSNFNTIGAPS